MEGGKRKNKNNGKEKKKKMLENILYGKCREGLVGGGIVGKRPLEDQRSDEISMAQ